MGTGLDPPTVADVPHRLPERAVLCEQLDHEFALKGHYLSVRARLDKPKVVGPFFVAC